MWSKLFQLFRNAADAWSLNRAHRMAAALAFYVMLSLSPLIIAAVGIADIFVSRAMAIDELLHQVELIGGPVMEVAVANFINNTVESDQGVAVGAVTLFLLLFGASNVFSQLYDSFNTIWGVKPIDRREGLVLYLKRRALAFVWVGGAGLIILALVITSTTIAAVNTFLADQAPGLFERFLPMVDFTLSLILLTVLFSAMFKALPQTMVYWRDVYWGGGLTAVLFIIGKYGLSFYLSRGVISSTYGRAGSLVVILIWVYYSGMIFFFGAEFTKAYATLCGSRRPPDQ